MVGPPPSEVRSQSAQLRRSRRSRQQKRSGERRPGFRAEESGEAARMHGGDAARGNHTVVSPASGKGIKRHTFFSPPVDSSTATSPPLPEKMTEKRERKKGRKQNRTPLIFQTFVLLGLANFPGRSTRAGSTPSSRRAQPAVHDFCFAQPREVDRHETAEKSKLRGKKNTKIVPRPRIGGHRNHNQTRRHGTKQREEKWDRDERKILRQHLLPSRWPDHPSIGPVV